MLCISLRKCTRKNSCSSSCSAHRSGSPTVRVFHGARECWSIQPPSFDTHLIKHATAMMESLKTAYKAAKRAYEADQTSESLKQEYVAAKKRYKQSKPGPKDVLAPPGGGGGGGNSAPPRADMDGGSARDGPQEGRKSAGTVKRKKRRKQKVIPGFVPYRKLVAKALETAGSKGLTKAALSEAVFESANKDILSKLKEGYEQQLVKMIAQAKLIVLDGNKVKLFRFLDERAVARFKAAAAERKKAAAEGGASR